MKGLAVQGQLRRDKFFFPLRVNGKLVNGVVLDTGAFEFVVSEPVAQQIGLRKGTRILVRGVSGTTRAWKSSCTLAISGRTFRNVPCVIIRDLPFNALFGLRFFVDQKYRLQLDPASAKLYFLK